VEARWLTQVNEAGETLRPILLKEQRQPITLHALSLKVWPKLEPLVSTSTLELYKLNMHAVLISNLGSMYLQNIDQAAIDEFTQARLKEVGPSCVNNCLRILRRSLRLAEEWKLLTRAPKIRTLPKEHERDFVISEELLTKMLEHKDCHPALHTLVPFLIDTGLRTNEAMALKWEHVGLTPKTGASLGWVQVIEGKSDAAKRHVPLTERAHKILKEIKKTSKSPYVFPATDGGMQSRHVPSASFRVLRDAMKLPKDCVLHSSRHTFCTRLGEAGVDSFTLKALAGHSSVKISEKYVHPTGKIKEAAVGKLNGAYKMPTEKE
jgi:integrase